ncbi:putative oxidoreductase CzcO [Variovorax sp. PBS-H4]|uniref:flavin-containing monooxygenase n=1 Tax=Variovorax sp. PBS-H4 TaxID=434008 RepID=UPI001317B935|nr:NAD(P)-binding domain-containing protein [Variovorax sp. PBS-H4]VTU21531.1 putative oxidoreductase CzcO [Variovorax sp. PBS-H4]
MQKVAVIGAGPGGLVAARYLGSEGFAPVLFEQAATPGGQWSGDASCSGVWPSMRTNTSRVLTQFSDLPHAPGLATYPSNREIGEYLQRYAARFDLPARTRLNTPVREIRAARGGWAVRHGAQEEIFEKVVVASGRFQQACVPQVQGLESFSGDAGVAHTRAYKDPQRYRGKRVLVAGCAISALEIASDLCMLGAERVVVCNRRQRYVLPKLIAGVPSDHRVFTRYQALAEESLPPAEFGAMLKELVLDAVGSPEQYGAPKPADSIFDAGLTLSQHYLPLVAEGRIEVRPWVDRVDGTQVRFTDGRTEAFDGILFGTGFELSLPFLSEAIRRTLDLDAQHIDLYKHTFHPELPGLAFVGMWDQSGPMFPPLELQARWLAYAWSGAVAAPTDEEMQRGIAGFRARRGQPQKTKANLIALLFARAAGVEPEPARWPELQRALLFGPLAPISFRLQGRDALPEAASRFASEAMAFGCVQSPEFSAAELQKLQRLGAGPMN